MPVEIYNKDYWTVAERIAKFRDEFPDRSIETQLISHDPEKVIMKALIMEGENIISTGYSEEYRDASAINKTSAMENSETSAVGRALAFFGLAGTEIASADEVAAAITQQREKELYASFHKTTQANRENNKSLLAMSGFLAEENWSAAKEAWHEISVEDKNAIWKATTKGGWFTTAERDQIKNWPSDA